MSLSWKVVIKFHKQGDINILYGGLEPDPTRGFGSALAAALVALFLFALVQLLVPLLPGVVKWVGSLF